MGEVYHKGHCDLSNLVTTNMRIGENDIVGVNGTDSTMSFVNTAEEVPHSNKEVPLDHLETTAKGTVRDAFAVSMFEKGNMNLELSVLPNSSLDSTSVAPLNPGAPSSVSAKMTHSPYKPLKLTQALPSGGSNVPVSPKGPLKSGKTSLKGTGMNPFSKCYVPQSLPTVPQPSQQLYGLLSTFINSAEVDARAMNTANIGHNPSFHSNTLTHNGTVAAEPILPQSAQHHYRSQRHTVGSVSQARSRGPPLMPHHLYTTKKVYPCVDFQHGKCCRGNDCRFAHVSLEDINAEIARLDADKEAYSNKCIGPSQSCTPQRSYEIPVVGRGQGEINLSEISIPNICLNVQTNQSTSVSCGGYSTNHIMDNQLVPSSSNKHYNQPYTYNESLSSNYSAEFSKLGNLSHHHHHNWLMNPSDTLIPVHPPWGLFSPQLQTNTNQPINTVSVLQQQYTAPVFPGLYDTGSMPIIPARSMTISEDLVCGALTGSNSSNPNHIFSNTQGELPYMLHSSLMNSGKKIPYHHDPYNRFSSSLVNSDVSNPISNPPESSSSVYMYPHSMTSEDTHSIQVLFKSDSYPVPMAGNVSHVSSVLETKVSPPNTSVCNSQVMQFGVQNMYACTAAGLSEGVSTPPEGVATASGAVCSSTSATNTADKTTPLKRAILWLSGVKGIPMKHLMAAIGEGHIVRSGYVSSHEEDGSKDNDKQDNISDITNLPTTKYIDNVTVCQDDNDRAFFILSSYSRDLQKKRFFMIDGKKVPVLDLTLFQVDTPDEGEVPHLLSDRLKSSAQRRSRRELSSS